MSIRVTPKTHYLFLRIFAEVSRAPKGLTVAEVAARMGCETEVIAHCIALHLYAQGKLESHFPIPPPRDYRVPGPDEVITREELDRPNAGRMEVVEKEIAALLAQLKRAEKRLH